MEPKILFRIDRLVPERMRWAMLDARTLTPREIEKYLDEVKGLQNQIHGLETELTKRRDEYVKAYGEQVYAEALQVIPHLRHSLDTANTALILVRR